MKSFSEIIYSEKPTLVDFYADWCGPCKMQAPVLVELSKKIGRKAKILKVNVDKNQAVSQAYGIRSIPTLLLFRKGKVIWRHMGFASFNELFDVLNYHASEN